MSGSKLITGSYATGIMGTEEREVRVWRLDTLEPEHTLKQPAGDDVLSLFGLAGEVWGGVGEQLVVWGRSS